MAGCCGQLAAQKECLVAEGHVMADHDSHDVGEPAEVRVSQVTRLIKWQERERLKRLGLW